MKQLEHAVSLLAPTADVECSDSVAVTTPGPLRIMSAFIEDICEHAGIIRVGPETNAYGKPFDMAAAFKVEIDADGHRVATIKALTTCLVPVTVAHTRAALNALAERGLKVRWFRISQNGTHEREVRPSNVGHSSDALAIRTRLRH